jgi:hypothetical protein
MAAAEGELKSPCYPPFSKGEFSPWDSHPSLEKRGRGDFLGELGRELCGELLGQDTSFTEEKFACL